MTIRDRSQSTTPTKALFAFIFVAPLVDILYSAHELSLPPLYESLSPLAFLGLICWWLEKDSKRTGVSWPLDLGMFLYAAWILILPYHLFKTRGLQGFFGILAFLGALLSGWIAAALFAYLLWN